MCHSSGNEPMNYMTSQWRCGYIRTGSTERWKTKYVYRSYGSNNLTSLSHWQATTLQCHTPQLRRYSDIYTNNRRQLMNPLGLCTARSTLQNSNSFLFYLGCSPPPPPKKTKHSPHAKSSLWSNISRLTIFHSTNAVFCKVTHTSVSMIKTHIIMIGIDL